MSNIYLCPLPAIYIYSNTYAIYVYSLPVPSIQHLSSTLILDAIHVYIYVYIYSRTYMTGCRGIWQPGSELWEWGVFSSSRAGTEVRGHAVEALAPTGGGASSPHHVAHKPTRIPEHSRDKEILS